MRIHWGRLFLVLGVVAVLSAGSAGLYYALVRGSNESKALTASAEKFLAEGDFASADIEVEKLLRVDANAGYPHCLKAQVLLEGKPLTAFSPIDPKCVNAVRQLLKATTKERGLHTAHKQLVAYFLNSGEVGPAAEHARAILEGDQTDREARYVLAASMLPDRAQEAAPFVDELLQEEKPPRARTLWLAAQTGDAIKDRGDLITAATTGLETLQVAESDPIVDRMAQVELRLWKAWRSSESAVIHAEVRASMAELRSISTKMATSHLSPRLILRTASRLIPKSTRDNPTLEEAYRSLQAEVDQFTDDVFRIAADAKVLDPALYVGQARRLRARGESAEAVKLLEGILAVAASKDQQTRELFIDADLWLAEHFIDEGKGELAEPYIATLLANPAVKPAGQMLAGYRLIQKGRFHEAAEQLSAALPRLKDHGAAHALYGLCQLRRGMISEGRQQLEEGIRLGAKSPRYKAWLALALAEGGYHDQALSAARELTEKGEFAVIGRALVGQIRLQTGDYKQAAGDLAQAYESADAEFRPAIRLAQAELAFSEQKLEQAFSLLEEVKQTSLADQAYALHYRLLRRASKDAQADSMLDEARSKLPLSTLLLATQVQRMMELERYDDAAAMLAKSRELSPEAVAPILLMAEVYEQAGKPDKGIEVLQQASQQLPGEPTLKIRLVERLLTRRQFPDAEKLLGQMRQDGKFNATTVDYLLARSAALQGDVKAAHELITQAAAKDPDNPSLKFMMGQLAAQKGDYSTASSMFEQSLAGGNDRQQAVHALFESLLRLGDTSRAIEVLSQAEKRGQEVRDLRKRLLQLLARQENWNTLDAEVSALLTKTPTEDDYLLVVSSFRYVHQPTRAAEFLRKALLDFPASYALREQEVSLLVETEDYDQADRKLSALIAQQPANPMLHVLRIHMYDATKRTEAWKSAVEDAWQKCPGHPAIAALRVRSLLKDGHIEQAMEFAEKARRDYPDLPDPRYLVARMQESLGNTDKALALLNVLVAEDPKNAKAAENYFRLVVQGGLPRDVEPAIEKLISNQPDNAMLIGALAEYKALQGDLASAERTIAKLEGNKNAGSMSDYARAVLAFARRDFKEAERLCNIVTADSKGHMPATFLLARLRAAEGEYSEAIDLAARVCRQQPTNPTSALFLGRLFGETNQWPKCEELCRGFLKEQKSDRSMRLLLARALLARGGDSRSKEAAGLAWSVFEEGIRGGEELEAVMNILFSGGQSEKCRQIISELEARGATPENLLAAGRASFIASDYATAARLADQVLVAKPDDLNALMLAADTETRVGFAGDDPVRYEKAVELYGRILEKDPKSQPAANNLAWTLGVCLGKESRALETLFRHVPAAADRSPMVSLDVLDTVGTLYLRMNRLDQAQEYFETIVQREPSNAMGNFRLGQIFDRRGRGDRAEPCYAKAKKLAPTENWEARKAEAGLGN